MIRGSKVFRWFYPSLLWRGSPKEKELFLTFDDGPVNGPTEYVLGLLKDHGIAATFFCVGNNVDKHRPVMEQIVDEGHAIGNHTYHHINGWNTPCEQYTSDVLACDKVLPVRTSLFRPPHGKITRAQIRQLSHRDIVMWDVITYDHDRSVSHHKCLKHTIDRVRNGSIVVFHDSYKAAHNMERVLPAFIRYANDEGYRFSLLNKLARAVH